MKGYKLILPLAILCLHFDTNGQNHPEIYIKESQKTEFVKRVESSERVSEFVDELKIELEPYVARHVSDPEWIVSRLQMYWNTKYKRVYVNGMDFSHGEGEAPVPTVKFSGSRDWATDYLLPEIKDIKPYLDDPRGMFLQNDKKEGKPWEWVAPSETGHIIENINRKIMKLAEDASFLYWLIGDERYAKFASDIVIKYSEGMYHRDAPQTIGDHKNALLMGLQTFEVIHEGIVEPYTVAYDFLFDYLTKNKKDVQMIQSVFRKWADQEIKYGVADNNWNMMQARFITYLAIALEDDVAYSDGKGQQYYIDQVLNQNSVKQKALKDVLLNFDPETAIWPEVAHYSIMVSDDLLEIYSILDKTMNNNLLAQSPILEKAILANFQYLFPNDFTAAYGDAKHSPLRYNSLELLISNYHKYGAIEKEKTITKQLRRFLENGAYTRTEIKSLFDLFFYQESLMEIPAAKTFAEMVTPTFYSPNVSWIVQRNGNSIEEGMMVSKNASLGNHSHTNGINLELFAKGMVIAPDAAAGVSYWSPDHIEYYSRFPAHNTVIVDGKSDYRNMRGTQAFSVNGIYPIPNQSTDFSIGNTFSDVSFTEPSTGAAQRRLTGTVRTSSTSGYFVDIFRSAREDGRDKKHEYLFHSQGNDVVLQDEEGQVISTLPTEELASSKGDLVGYDYFKDKQSVSYNKNFVAMFEMPSITGKELKVNLWMKGYKGREIFTVKAPHSRAINSKSVPEELYHKESPTLVVRQSGEAHSRPFVTIIDAFNTTDNYKIENVNYFSSQDTNSDFIGVDVSTSGIQKDYIFNDTKGKRIYKTSNGNFKGTYGVISTTKSVVKSLFLGNGELLEKEGWKIEASNSGSNILLERTSDGFFIDASHNFILTIPTSGLASKAQLYTVNKDGIKRSFKRIEVNKSHLKFKIPALSGVQLFME
ncbi:Heparinase II/III-like protein [Spirosomataceae bacterium TFI 002]|nr:Heparinase II/III-like protein [Spirosomataceae bacterium TFI 002]